MRRFLITSPNFYGHFEVVYGMGGLVQKIDFAETTMSMNMRRTVFEKIKSAMLVDQVAELVGGTSATIVEAEFEIDFEMFWTKYNKKINKIRCIPLWNKLNKADQVKAFYGIDSYDKFLNRLEVRQKLDPENYIKNHSWENEWR